MKSYQKIFLLFALCLPMAACSDLFETDPDNIINSTDYISKDDEIYRGYFGILTKLQEAGDHSILLTDTRGDYLEVTRNAPLELQQIYNYEPTNGNPYADPSCYYAIVIAANDFISKVSEYSIRTGKTMDAKTLTNVKTLVSSAIRLKVWSYLQLAKIYGKAVWFDDPLEQKIALTDTTTFTNCENYLSVIDKCINLMTNGVTLMPGVVVPSNLYFDWATYMNEEKSVQTTEYNHWNHMVPRALMLNLELRQWRGTRADYLYIKNTILDYLNKLYNGTPDPEIMNFDKLNCMYYYQCNIPLTGNYHNVFFNQLYNSSNNTNMSNVINGIMYDYDNHQTNRIIEYFCPQSPGKYYLRPTAYAMSKFGARDARSFSQRQCMNVINGDTCFTKYYYYRGTYLRSNLLEINPVIPTYRGHDFHFMLAEAENHLGNWRVTRDLINRGLINDPDWVAKVVPANKGWDSRYLMWAWGKSFTDGYSNNGIVGCVNGDINVLPEPTDAGYNLTEAVRIKIYDLAIANEAMREYTCEGKSYGYLVRMAEKYKEPVDGTDTLETGSDIVANRVCPKYPVDKQATIRTALQNGGYWVDWDMKVSR